MNGRDSNDNSSDHRQSRHFTSTEVNEVDE